MTTPKKRPPTVSLDAADLRSALEWATETEDQIRGCALEWEAMLVYEIGEHLVQVDISSGSEPSVTISKKES